MPIRVGLIGLGEVAQLTALGRRASKSPPLTDASPTLTASIARRYNAGAAVTPRRSSPTPVSRPS